jgi:hypothetical protein
MAADIDTSNEIGLDIGYGVDTGSDHGGDLADDIGVDLNSDDASKANFAKAAMAYDIAPPPENMHIPNLFNDYAIYADAPEHVGKTPEQIATEMQENFQDIGTDMEMDMEHRGSTEDLNALNEPEYGEYDD